MERSGGRGSLVAGVTVLALLVAPLPALAAFAVNIQGPGPYSVPGGITVFDDTSGVLLPLGMDQNTVPGVISITTGSGGLPAGFSLHSDLAQSNSPGGPSFSLLDLGWSLNASGGGAGGTIQVTASATDFTFPPTGAGSILTSLSGALIPAGGVSSLAAQQGVDLSNALFGLGLVTPGLHGPFSTAFFNSASTPFGSATPYSITDRLSLTLGANAVASGDLQSTVVPEPVTMFLGGTGLLVLAYAGRRRLFGR